MSPRPQVMGAYDVLVGTRWKRPGYRRCHRCLDRCIVWSGFSWHASRTGSHYGYVLQSVPSILGLDRYVLALRARTSAAPRPLVPLPPGRHRHGLMVTSSNHCYSAPHPLMPKAGLGNATVDAESISKSNAHARWHPAISSAQLRRDDSHLGLGARSIRTVVATSAVLRFCGTRL